MLKYSRQIDGFHRHVIQKISSKPFNDRSQEFQVLQKSLIKKQLPYVLGLWGTPFLS